MRAAVVALALLASAAEAQPVPFGDAPVRLRGDVLVVSRLGSPDARAEGLPAMRASARRRGRARASSALHAYVDRKLAEALATPALTSRVHAALSAGTRVEATRSLVDGSVVVRVALPLVPLRALFREAGVQP